MKKSIPKYYYVYILASKRNGTLYTGVTNNLLRRVYEHKKKIIKGFTSKYDVNMLVYFEETDNIYYAIGREKQIKKWLRKWKLKTIEEFNPDWKDLYYEYGGTDSLFDQYFEEKKKTDSRIRGNDKSILSFSYARAGMTKAYSAFLHPEFLHLYENSS